MMMHHIMKRACCLSITVLQPSSSACTFANNNDWKSVSTSTSQSNKMLQYTGLTDTNINNNNTQMILCKYQRQAKNLWNTSYIGRNRHDINNINNINNIASNALVFNKPFAEAIVQRRQYSQKRKHVSKKKNASGASNHNNVVVPSSPIVATVSEDAKKLLAQQQESDKEANKLLKRYKLAHAFPLATMLYFCAACFATGLFAQWENITEEEMEELKQKHMEGKSDLLEAIAKTNFYENPFCKRIGLTSLPERKELLLFLLHSLEDEKDGKRAFEIIEAISRFEEGEVLQDVLTNNATEIYNAIANHIFSTEVTSAAVRAIAKCAVMSPTLCEKLLLDDSSAERANVCNALAKAIAHSFVYLHITFDRLCITNKTKAAKVLPSLIEYSQYMCELAKHERVAMAIGRSKEAMSYLKSAQRKVEKVSGLHERLIGELLLSSSFLLHSLQSSLLPIMHHANKSPEMEQKYLAVPQRTWKILAAEPPEIMNTFHDLLEQKEGDLKAMISFYFRWRIVPDLLRAAGAGLVWGVIRAGINWNTLSKIDMYVKNTGRKLLPHLFTTGTYAAIGAASLYGLYIISQKVRETAVATDINSELTYSMVGIAGSTVCVYLILRAFPYAMIPAMAMIY